MADVTGSTPSGHEWNIWDPRIQNDPTLGPEEIEKMHHALKQIQAAVEHDVKPYIHGDNWPIDAWGGMKELGTIREAQKVMLSNLNSLNDTVLRNPDNYYIGPPGMNNEIEDLKKTVTEWGVSLEELDGIRPVADAEDSEVMEKQYSLWQQIVPKIEALYRHDPVHDMDDHDPETDVPNA